MRRFRVPEIVLAAVFGLVLGIGVAEVASFQTEHCHDSGNTQPYLKQPTNSPDNPPDGQRRPSQYYQRHPISCEIGGLAPSVVAYMDEHEGFFVGSFTLFLFISTALLWAAGERQFALSERAAISLDGFIVELSTAAEAGSVSAEMLPERYRRDPGLYLSRCAIIPRWKNSGKTPTKNMTIQVRWGGPDWELISDDTFTYIRDPFPFFVPPGGEELSRAIEIPPARAIIDWSFNPVPPEPLILIWGRADYEDIFGKRHILEWCRELRLDRHDGVRLRANFIQWGWYNRSYEP